jgi:hypothetical protein
MPESGPCLDHLIGAFVMLFDQLNDFVQRAVTVPAEDPCPCDMLPDFGVNLRLGDRIVVGRESDL